MILRLLVNAEQSRPWSVCGSSRHMSAATSQHKRLRRLMFVQAIRGLVSPGELKSVFQPPGNESHAEACHCSHGGILPQAGNAEARRRFPADCW
ncbi:MAG: hypothetical protein ACOZAQ_04270 [Pseudomonadota bacterium]